MAFVRSSKSDRDILSNDILRISREFDGGSASLTSVSGSDSGVLRFKDKGKNAEYTIVGSGTSEVITGSADYVGVMTIDYRTGGSSAQRFAEGDMGVTIDFDRAEFSAGGMADNSEGSIEVFADGNYANGSIDSTSALVRRRNSNGLIIADYEGNVDGILTAGDNGRNALIGTVDGSGDDGFRMIGGFVANETR